MKEIGGYQLLRELPASRAGLRYVAASPRPTGPDDEIVALTLIDADLLGDPAYLALLNTEAAPAIAFRHPSSVRVIEVNRIADEVAIVVELVDGQPLSELLERTAVRSTRLGWEYFTWAGAQIAALLQVAHATPWAEGEVKGMFHGQLCPNDIYVTYGGMLKVNGIGLGRSRARLPLPAHRLPYHAPELFERHKADHLTDVYGLGLTLHDAISGRRTFARDTEPAMRRAVAESTVPPLHLDAPTVPPALETLLGSMVAKSAGERPSSLFEIERGLREHLEHDDAYYASGLAEHMKILFRTSSAAPAPPPVVMLKEPPPLSSPPDEAWVSEPGLFTSLPDDGFIDELGIEELVEALAHRRAPVNAVRARPIRTAGDSIPEALSSDAFRPVEPEMQLEPPLAMFEDDERHIAPTVPGHVRPWAAPPRAPPPRPPSSVAETKPGVPPVVVPRGSRPDEKRSPSRPDAPASPWAGPLSAPRVPKPTNGSSDDPSLLGALDDGSSDDLDSLVDAIVASGSRPSLDSQDIRDFQAEQARQPTPTPPITVDPTFEPPVELHDFPLQESPPSPWARDVTPMSSHVPEQVIGPQLQEGDVLGDRYEILGLLGEGGVSVVYRAEHRLLAKMVAVKVMRPELTALPTAKERFQREARAVSQLDHPNIARVTDFGYAADGRMYLVMELVEGQSLGQMIEDSTSLPPSTAMAYAVHLLRGLRHAHERGIVHRDLKPDNIVVAQREGIDLPKILDFGIAKITDETSSGGRAITQAGTVFGTPRYMSPEQAAGEQIDERTDLYTIGVILYQMLTGRLPFDGESTVQILSRVLTQPPPPLQVIHPTREAGKAIERLVLKALEKERDDRYSSATDFLTAIEEVVRAHGLS